MNIPTNIFFLPFNTYGAKHIIFSEIINKGEIVYIKEESTLYLSEQDRYKIYFSLIKDFNEAINLCFSYAKEKLYKKINNQ